MKTLLRCLLFVAVGFQFIACELKPTKGESTREYNKSDLQVQAARPLKITDNMVLIDARPSFEYALAHVPNSYNLAWEDFTQDSGRSSGLVKSDVAEMAKRLALYGVSLNTPVLVIGRGTRGEGEEGRMAWLLYYLGVKNVQFVSIDFFKTKLTQQESPAAKNAPDWTPQLRFSVNVSRAQLIKDLFPKGHARSANVHLIDVRTAREYLEDKSSLDLSPMNVEWKEFLTAEGRVNLNLATKLKGVGFHEGDLIYVISNRGMRSALATMALLSMGFQNAANFAGGYWDLEKSPPRIPKKSR